MLSERHHRYTHSGNCVQPPFSFPAQLSQCIPFTETAISRVCCSSIPILHARPFGRPLTDRETMLHVKLRFKVKPMTNVLTIGQVARQAGLKPSAVRYYERHRIIPPAQRLPNGYRVYDAETLRWLSFVRRAQGFGMSLENVKELLQLASHGRTPCERVRQLETRALRELRTAAPGLEHYLRAE